ncbi:unnamed protein product [Acidithrix sp. C25]|nr:unnamed protein product [Acidithrix sp. C25]
MDYGRRNSPFVSFAPNYISTSLRVDFNEVVDLVVSVTFGQW